MPSGAAGKASFLNTEKKIICIPSSPRALRTTVGLTDTPAAPHYVRERFWPRNALIGCITSVKILGSVGC
jgi:hypothetical protein